LSTEVRYELRLVVPFTALHLCRDFGVQVA